MTKHTLDRLEALGFDKSSNRSGWPNLLDVGCSQCNSLVINGVAAHELGCPNKTYECKGCNNPVSRRGAYCEGCR